MKPGDIVRITAVRGTSEDWIGLEATVVEPPDDRGDVLLIPMTKRPDNGDVGQFYWSGQNLEMVTPKDDVADRDAVLSFVEEYAKIDARFRKQATEKGFIKVKRYRVSFEVDSETLRWFGGDLDVGEQIESLLSEGVTTKTLKYEEI